MSDVRDAFRSLRATPIVSIVAILSLALGIGANTAIFSILDTLVLRTLPVHEPDRLVLIADKEGRQRSMTNPIWEQVRAREGLFDGAFAWSTTRFDLAQQGPTEPVEGLWASGRFFDVLGVPAVLGRTFTADDDRRGGGPDGPVAVISHAFWQRRFGGAADVIGRPITVERVAFTIVGVTPPSFFGMDVGRRFDVAIPIGAEPLIRGRESFLDRRSTWWLGTALRLKPDQSLAAALTALRGVQPQIREATLPLDWRPQDLTRYLGEPLNLIEAGTGRSGLRSVYRRPLTTIMVVVALVLLIACANIANLLLARATARRHELSIRVALGASRWRVARQLLTESLVLSALGAIVGLVFAQWGSRLLVGLLSSSTNTVFLALAVDWRILAFTAAVAVTTAVLFGVAPALRGTRVQPQDALKSQGRGVAGDERLGLGSALVVAQVALSLVLVVAAGLFVRTFTSLARLDLGFDRDPVMVVTASAQRAQLEFAARPELFRRALEAVRAVPGVAHAGLSAVTPVSGSTWNDRVEFPDGGPAQALSERERNTYINLVSDDYFRTYGTALLAGREFDARDDAAALPVAIVNETFARRFNGGRNPVGLRIRQPGFGAQPSVDRVVVGYVRDAVYHSLREPVPPTLYVPYRQRFEPPSTMAISVRAASGSPALLTRSLAAALTRVHPDLALTFRPLADQVHATLIQERVVALLSGFFGALALLLAGLGLYGVTAYAVSRRRTEIGIRMALGANPHGVVMMVLRRVAALVGLGALVGAAISLWASRFVATLLYGLEARDPLTLSMAMAVLAGIGVLAGWLPARRAARIDPARVLRDS